jgi:methylenetetrahydrofolate--tRNA-(uracil-5-)-methyltransferase
MPHVYFAGQITGVEGYLESTASGLATAIGAAFRTMGKEIPVPSGETAVGALLRHTHTKPAKRFEPMNINFGIIDSAPEGVHKRERKTAVVARALTRIREWRALVDERSPQS